MAVPVGPQQTVAAAKKRSATGPANSSPVQQPAAAHRGVARKRRPEGTRPAATDCNATKNRPELAQAAGATPAATPRDSKQPEPVPAAVFAARPLPTDRDAKKSQGAAAAPSCNSSAAPDGGKAKRSGDEGAKNCGAPNAATAASDSGGLGPKKQFQATAAAASGSGGLGPKKQFQATAAAAAASDSGGLGPKKQLQATAAAATTTSGNRKGEQGPQEDPATCIPGEKSPESVLMSATALFCHNSFPSDRGRPNESRNDDAKNCCASEAADVGSDSGVGVLDRKKRLQPTTVATISTSVEKRGEEVPEGEPAAACAPSYKEWTKSASKGGGKDCGDSCGSTTGSKKNDDEMCVGVLRLFSRPWMQQQRSSEGPDFLWKKTPLLNRLLECCGLGDLTIGKDLKVPHVNEKRTPISEAKSYYKMKQSVAEKLLKVYSSFRVVLGDGECFYRSFIYSYMEIVLDSDDTSEEERLLCSIEKVSLACVAVEWLYDDFKTQYTAFKELVQKVKIWKSETRAARRMQLLAFFGDYQESEAILSFLRISATAWILTHPDFSAFYVIEDGITLEEHCRAEILRRRSYADNLAIGALVDALGIEIRIFCLQQNDENQEELHMTPLHMTPSGDGTTIPRVYLAYTGIHYDILYPI